MLAASIRQSKIGIALALLDRSHEKQIKLTLADVFIDRALRKKGTCTKLVSRLFPSAAKHKPSDFHVFVSPRPGTDTGLRACSCYIKALRQAFENNITKMTIEYNGGETIGDNVLDDSFCREGKLDI